MASPRENIDPRKELAPLLMKHRNALFGYIYSLVPNRADAEDILQDVSTILWEKIDDFEPGTNFKAWAKKVAFWEIKSRRKTEKRSKVLFDDELLEKVSETASEMEEELSDRHLALEHCLSTLSGRDRGMLLTRYSDGEGVESAARESGRSLPATYKALGRLRRVLLNCVTRRVESAQSVLPEGGRA